MSAYRAVTVEQVDYRYSVTFAYNAELVEILKDTVFWRGREWDAASRRWLVDSLYIDELTRAFRDAGCTVRGNMTRRQPPEAGQAMSDDLLAPTWSMILFARVHTEDPESVEQFYRAVRRAVRRDPALRPLLRELRAGYRVISEAHNVDRTIGIHESNLGNTG